MAAGKAIHPPTSKNFVSRSDLGPHFRGPTGQLSPWIVPGRRHTGWVTTIRDEIRTAAAPMSRPGVTLPGPPGSSAPNGDAPIRMRGMSPRGAPKLKPRDGLFLLPPTQRGSLSILSPLPPRFRGGPGGSDQDPRMGARAGEEVKNRKGAWMRHGKQRKDGVRRDATQTSRKARVAIKVIRPQRNGTSFVRFAFTDIATLRHGCTESVHSRHSAPGTKTP